MNNALKPHGFDLTNVKSDVKQIRYLLNLGEKSLKWERITNFKN